MVQEAASARSRAQFLLRSIGLLGLLGILLLGVLLGRSICLVRVLFGRSGVLLLRLVLLGSVLLAAAVGSRLAVGGLRVSLFGLGLAVFGATLEGNGLSGRVGETGLDEEGQLDDCEYPVRKEMYASAKVAWNQGRCFSASKKKNWKNLPD